VLFASWGASSNRLKYHVSVSRQAKSSLPQNSFSGTQPESAVHFSESLTIFGLDNIQAITDVAMLFASWSASSNRLKKSRQRLTSSQSYLTVEIILRNTARISSLL
jgi:hypothetical protein